MACALTQGKVRKACKVPAGLKSILFGEIANVLWRDATKFAYTANVVTTLTMVATKQMWRYEMPAGVATLKMNKTGKSANGSYKYTPTLTLQVEGIETAMQEEIDLLMKNNLFAICEDNSGDYWLVGHEYGLDTDSNMDFGTDMADFIGDKITMVGAQTLTLKKVTSSLITTLLAPAA